MSIPVEEPTFFSFVCPSCLQEIEAPTDLIGQKTECPACAAVIRVPTEKSRAHTQAQLDAMKSRTIRIELPGCW